MSNRYRGATPVVLFVLGLMTALLGVRPAMADPSPTPDVSASASTSSSASPTSEEDGVTTASPESTPADSASATPADTPEAAESASTPPAEQSAPSDSDRVAAQRASGPNPSSFAFETVNLTSQVNGKWVPISDPGVTVRA